uniref:DDE-1 domain-containing protein n=1 Tax=Timema shepardi TaxID=629360 RepID=A0A7R9B7D2_TIMSH|nr:unnamed protein product [Timema shepardi]
MRLPLDRSASLPRGALGLGTGNSDAPSDLESSEVSLAYQKDAQMDLTTMKTWLERIWFKRVLSPSLLIADCYEPHCVPNITDIFRTRGCHSAVIPGGCTSRLQPLDITVKREFQDVIEKQWNSFNSISNGSWDTQNKLQLPGQREIIDWVSAAYRHVQANQQETIRRSFLVTRLSITPDHNEDHFIDNLCTIPNS